MPEPWRDELSSAFLEHYDSLRGVVRRELIARQLEAHLPPPPAHVLDIGAGDGAQGIRLARARYAVTLADPSAEMVAFARRAIDAEDAATRARLTVERLNGAECLARFGESSFEAVLCHGVVMYQDSSTPTIDVTGKLVQPGGVVSLVAKNAEALALRPALQGRWHDARSAFDRREDVGGLGVRTRGDTISELTEAFRCAGLDPLAWYGIRVLTDHLAASKPDDDLEPVLAAEWLAGKTDPYRSLARLLHVLGVRRARAPTRGGHVRAATLRDVKAIVRIYNEGIDDRLATFETRHRTVDDVRQWFGVAFPLVVVVGASGTVVAWASAPPYRDRPCYAGVAEFSVYVARDHRGHGYGHAALTGLIEECRRRGLWKLVSRIFPENAASRALCRSAGFREVGV